MKVARRTWLTLLGLSLVLLFLFGCGGTDSARLLLNVFERSSWEPVAEGRVALSAIGGNGMLYVYKVKDDGTSFTLLTPSKNDPQDVQEGGWHPAFSPTADRIAFASRRGPTVTLFTMDPEDGDRTGVVKLTTDTPTGEDVQPSWSPDGARIIYSTTRLNGTPDIRTVKSDGTGDIVDLISNQFANEWPSYKPTDPNVVLLQSNYQNGNPNDTDLFLFTVSTGVWQKIVDSDFADGAPAWSPDGTKVAFHSNRSGVYDIWLLDLNGNVLTPLTTDGRSDGFPAWNVDGSRIAFTRDRELWSMNPDGSDQKRVVRRF